MMKKDNVVSFKTLDAFKHDFLTEVLRQGAQQLLIAAVEAEVEAFLEEHNSQKVGGDKPRFVRNGYLPKRDIQTGIGQMHVVMPRVRDRAFVKDGIRFGSSIVPKYLRRTGDLNELLPVLYLKGLSTNDFAEALTPLVGEQAQQLSPGVISRLKAHWEDEYDRWNERDLSGSHYVYWWVDGIHLEARMEDKQCALVVIGVTDKGKKELIAINSGYRESKESWLTLLNSVTRRGLTQPPLVAVGDGALGFWGALNEVFPTTLHQRCWFHKMGNVLDKLPKSLQSQAKAGLQEIWMSPTKDAADTAFDQFISDYQAKYPKATDCLLKDKEVLLTFYDFPAEHWQSLRTTNPIESTFATVRHRTRKAKGCFSRTTILTMTFKLIKSAEKRWHRLRGFEQLSNVIQGVKFIDGVREKVGNFEAENKVAA